MSNRPPKVSDGEHVEQAHHNQKAKLGVRRMSRESDSDYSHAPTPPARGNPQKKGDKSRGSASTGTLRRTLSGSKQMMELSAEEQVAQVMRRFSSAPRSSRRGGGPSEQQQTEDPREARLRDLRAAEQLQAQLLRPEDPSGTKTKGEQGPQAARGSHSRGSSVVSRAKGDLLRRMSRESDSDYSHAPSPPVRRTKGGGDSANNGSQPLPYTPEWYRQQATQHQKQQKRQSGPRTDAPPGHRLLSSINRLNSELQEEEESATAVDFDQGQFDTYQRLKQQAHDYQLGGGDSRVESNPPARRRFDTETGKRLPVPPPRGQHAASAAGERRYSSDSDHSVKPPPPPRQRRSGR